MVVTIERNQKDREQTIENFKSTLKEKEAQLQAATSWIDEIKNKRIEELKKEGEVRKRREVEKIDKDKEIIAVYEELSPMIKRLLEEIGASLCGKTLTGLPKYSVKEERATFSWKMEHEEVSGGMIVDIIEVIEVTLLGIPNNPYFGTKYTPLAKYKYMLDSRKEKTKETTDISEQQLKQALAEICT